MENLIFYEERIILADSTMIIYDRQKPRILFLKRKSSTAEEDIVELKFDEEHADQLQVR